MSLKLEARNSSLRKYTKNVMTFCASSLYHGIDKLTGIKIGPDVVTLVALAGTGFIAYKADDLNKKRFETGEDHLLNRAGLGLAYAAVCIGDGLDGALDRYLNSLDPMRRSSSYGSLLDVVADRLREGAMALSRARSAYRDGDNQGEQAAYLAAVTTTLPSLVRASGEGFFDRVSAESGNNFAELLGTSLGRMFLGGTATIAPREAKGIPIHKTLDGIQSGANILSTICRMQGIYSSSKANLSPKERQEARVRFAVLLGVELVMLKAIEMTYHNLRSEAA